MDGLTTTKIAPQQSSTTPGATTPPKSPQSPRTPSKTAELWDGYEKLAVEKAKERDEVTDQMHEPGGCSTTRSSFDFKFGRAPAATICTCKTCEHPITYASGICEHCIKSIAVPAENEETTPPISPAARSMVLSGLTQIPPRDEVITPTYTSPKRTSFCPMPSHLIDSSTRMSPTQPGSMSGRRKSPSEPIQPGLGLQITPQAYTWRSQGNSPPTTPTCTLLATQSLRSNRRSSLANVTMIPKPSYMHTHTRNDSGTPSEFSTIYQTASTATTPPASLHRFGYPLQNTTSAWDDWDSDEEGDRAGLASWMGRRRIKSRGGAGGAVGGGAVGSGGGAGKTSMDQCESSGEETRERMIMARKSRDDRTEQVRAEVVRSGSIRVERVGIPSKEKIRKPCGFVRALSCGCGGAE